MRIRTKARLVLSAEESRCILHCLVTTARSVYLTYRHELSAT